MAAALLIAAAILFWRRYYHRLKVIKRKCNDIDIGGCFNESIETGIFLFPETFRPWLSTIYLIGEIFSCHFIFSFSQILHFNQYLL